VSVEARPQGTALERTPHRDYYLSEHVAVFTIRPHAPARTSVVCEFLFHPSEMAKPGAWTSDGTSGRDSVRSSAVKA